MIDKFVDGDMNKVVRRKSIKEALRDGTPACMDITIEKRLRESRPKRAWMANNQDTRPWDIKELETKK
jgi:Cu2+-containing amine oxidase